MGKDDDDNQSDSWPWNDKTLQHLKTERDRFIREIEESEEQLRREGGNGGPFSAFKRFIDSNFNAISDGFKNFPSNVHEIKARMQREQERQRQEEQDISRRWTGSANSPDFIQMELARTTKEEREDAREATMLMLSESLRRNAHVSPEKIEALFEDKESMLGDLDRLVNPILALGGAWFYMPETGDKLPTAEERSLRWFGPMPRWLSVDWFKRSPYSPIRLEAHPDLGESGAKWRAAFEDLLSVTLDKPMVALERVGLREPYGKPQSTYYGPGLEWMLSLQCRGILPPLLPRFYSDMHGKQALRQGTILNVLAQSRKDLPWSSDHSLAWYSPIHRDFAELMSEIAIKSTADTEFEPMPHGKPYSQLPETELELYENPYVFPPAHNPSHNEEAQDDEVIADAVLIEGIRLFRYAYKNHDFEGLALLLERLDEKYGKDIVSESLQNAMDFSEDAMSNLRRHLVRQILLLEAMDGGEEEEDDDDDDDEDQDEEEDYEEDPHVEARKRRILGRMGELTGNRGYMFTLPLQDLQSLPRLERRLEAMEQEHENMQHMTGNKKQTPAVQAPVMHTPQVLSALTTTHTTRLPDGTVTTKVVLKKRFADGREEITENVHTANERLEEERKKQAEEKPEKKTGWFWS